MKKPVSIIGILIVISGLIITSVVLLRDNEPEIAENATADSNLQLSNETIVADAVDWCEEHSVPESECALCDPSLIEKYKAAGDWCAGHGLPESHCRLCNPGISFPQEKSLLIADGHSIEEGADLTELDWCDEHSVPESACALCDPSLIERYKASGDWCGGHDIPESHCRLCNPEIEFPQERILKARMLELSNDAIEVSLFFRPNSTVCATNGALIQFASSTTADRSGITVQRSIAAPYESALDAPAEIIFDENSTTVIASLVEVLVSRWLISPGDEVTENDPIAILQSSEMAELQARLLSASAELEVQEKELKRAKELVSKTLISKSDYENIEALNRKAQAEYNSVRGLLLSTGINNNDIDKLLASGVVSNEFVFRAPSSGIIAKRIAQVGELLEDGKALALLTDPGSLWIEAHLPEDQMNRVALGQDIFFASDDGSLNRVKGAIIWVSPYLDSHTRTGIVRAQVLDNTQGLRAGEFGRVTISETLDTESIFVPKDAVQWEGCCNVVFVKETANRFRPRKVQLADGPGSYYQVTEGLSAGEEIVIGGSFLLKTELKKTSIGAGCCGIEPVG